MKRVVIESPYAGRGETAEERARGVERNLRYLRACMADCLRRGEAPFASHGLYTQPGVLDDKVPRERQLGISAGFAWRDAAELTVVYVDIGVSIGMELGISDALSKGRPYEERSLGEDWDAGFVPCGPHSTLAHPAQHEAASRAIVEIASAFGVSVGEFERSLLTLARSLNRPAVPR